MIRRKKLTRLSDEVRDRVEGYLPDVYRILGRKIHRAARITRTPVEDLQQGMAMAICRAMSLWEEGKGRAFLSYCVMAAEYYLSNEFRSYYRKKPLRDAQALPLDGEPLRDRHHRPDPDAPLDAPVILSWLTPKQQEAVRSNIMEGDGVRSLAGESSVSHQAIADRVKAALKKIRKRLRA